MDDNEVADYALNQFRQLGALVAETDLQTLKQERELTIPDMAGP